MLSSAAALSLSAVLRLCCHLVSLLCYFPASLSPSPVFSSRLSFCLLPCSPLPFSLCLSWVLPSEHSNRTHRPFPTPHRPFSAHPWLSADMHRVFPVRPSESSLLVSYDNGAFEHDDAEQEVSSSSSSNLKGSSLRDPPRRCRSTSFSVTFCDDKSLSSPPQSNYHQKFPSVSVYPEFGEAASPSPRSSLWTCSFYEDGDSTSFNFSDGASHRRGTSSLSSSSSSSITYDPRSSASTAANSSNKEVDAAYVDDASFSCKDVNLHITGSKTQAQAELRQDSISVKTPLKPLQTSEPLTGGRRSTPTHDALKKRQESMHVSREAPKQNRLSHRSASSQKIAARPVESSRTSSCFPRSHESVWKANAPSTPPKPFSCSTPFKYLTRCVRTEKSSKTPQKEQHNSAQVSSPAKFSTLMNQLYAKGSPFQDGVSPKPRAASETEDSTEEASAMKIHVDDACSASDEKWKTSSVCQSFGADMISDYVRRIQDVGKSPSFRRAPKSSSFHHTSEVFSEASKRRACSMELTQKPSKASSTCSKEHDKLPEISVEREENHKILSVLHSEIVKMCQDKNLLARGLAEEISFRQSERKAAENALKRMEAAMEEKLIIVEKDHAHSQACLEKEIDRRKKDWAAKLDKIRLEEKKLRERVTEMALERVELQKSIAFHKGREVTLQTQANDHELSAQAWMRRHRQSVEEAQLLRQSFTTVSGKLGDKEHELDLVLQRSRLLERENTELLKESSRLRRAYAGQETTFEELWQRLVDIVNGPPDGKVDSLRKLHGELKVFSVREQALRYEISVLQSQLFSTKQRSAPVNQEGYSLSDDHGFLKKTSMQLRKDPSLEVLDGLVKKLELAKQHMRCAEHQLEVKEGEIGLLHSTVKERDYAMKDMQEELASVKAQRDSLRKEVQQMGQEALKLTQELSELRKVVEKLDDELMLKEGQISILRETCSDSDF